MIENSQSTWQWYEDRCREDHTRWLRSLTAEQSLELHEDLYRLAIDAQQHLPDRQRLERTRWEEKLALRQRMVTEFQQLDRARRERANS